MLQQTYEKQNHTGLSGLETFSADKTWENSDHQDAVPYFISFVFVSIATQLTQIKYWLF